MGMDQTCWWIFTRSSRAESICRHASTSGDLPAFNDFKTAWQYLVKNHHVLHISAWQYIPQALEQTVVTNITQANES